MAWASVVRSRSELHSLSLEALSSALLLTERDVRGIDLSLSDTLSSRDQRQARLCPFQWGDCCNVKLELTCVIRM